VGGGGCGRVGCVMVWGVCGVGEGVSLLRSNIPRSALCESVRLWTPTIFKLDLHKSEANTT
jgi:hypothetical protein